MLKLLLEKCIFAISFLTCLSLLAKLTATIIEFSVIRSSILGEKTFLPLTPSRWIWGDLRKGLLRTCKDFSCFSLWFYCIINVIPIFFANYLLSCFCNSTAFSFSVVFTWYCESGILVCEFIIHSKTFNLLRYIMALLLYRKSNNICSAYKSIYLLKFEELHPRLVLRPLEFPTAFFVDT